MTRTLEQGPRVITTAVTVVLLVVAVAVMRTEVRALTWTGLWRNVLAIPRPRLIAALAFTVANYALLTGYDLLAFVSIGKRLARARIALASFVAYATANNVGFAMLSGVSVRYRFYRRWGITGEELSRLVMAYSTTFWIGLLLLGGISLILADPGASESARVSYRVTGALLVCAPAAYVAAACRGNIRKRVFGVDLSVPGPLIANAQLLLSAVEWTTAAMVLYALLPAGRVPLMLFIGSFLAAHLVGLISHVPGGAGVFEASMLALLRPMLPSDQVLPALIAYRCVYYLLPLAIALAVLLFDELAMRREELASAVRAFRPSHQLVAHVLSICTFVSGVVLLASTATPAAAGRLAILDRVLPLGVVEVSHFVASIIGAGLLVVSQGLARRIDAAYLLAVSAIVIAIPASLFKGGDFEEAAFLSIVLAVLWSTRGTFNRRAALFDTRFSWGWVTAIGVAVGASMWLGFFAFRHVEYSNELWWQFELRAEASRFLRGAVGVSMVLFLVALSRLITRARCDWHPATDADLEQATRVIQTQTATLPYLVYLRDKSVLFDDDSSGFVMYGVAGRTWATLGDPVAPPNRFDGLIRLFLDRCEDCAGIPVFYQVHKEHLHHYADVGLTLAKLGEEAVVDLESFSIAGGEGRKHRYILNYLQREGASFRVVPAADVPAILDQLRDVSDDWLERKAAAEKRFSLGCFDPAYLSRFPVAVIEHRGRIVAFANVWPGPDHVELSLDLMRYHHEAPKDVMDGLFVHMLQWGRANGYRRFSLGMAPLSGIYSSPVAPLWMRLGGLMYRHGGAFYNFQGLRAYKQKFNPIWEPRYVAYPGRLRFATVMANVSALIAGGYRRILIK